MTEKAKREENKESKKTAVEEKFRKAELGSFATADCDKLNLINLHLTILPVPVTCFLIRTIFYSFNRASLQLLLQFIGVLSSLIWRSNQLNSILSQILSEKSIAQNAFISTCSKFHYSACTFLATY
uniref:Uncharacterized protein n=1 Tax=Cacopsylla melanoneura TaxID=428564 RepID=A0A8D8YM77_9HEMI